MKSGDRVKAREKLLPLIGRDYILEDYAALDLAQMEFLDGRPGFAKTVLNSVTARFPDSPIIKKLKEQTLRAACADPAPEACGVELEKISESDVNPQFIPERVMIESARHEAQGALAQAAAGYQRVYYDYPTAASAWRARENMERLAQKLYEHEQTAPEPDRQMLERRAQKLMAAFRYKEAEAELKLMLQNPSGDQADIMYKLGMAQYKARNREEAKNTFAMLSEDPESGQLGEMALRQMSVIDWNFDRADEARARLDTLVKDGKEPAIARQAHILAGKIAEANAEWETAAAHYRKALELSPSDNEHDDLLWRLGWLEYRRGSFENAAANFIEAHQKIPLTRQDGKFTYWAARAWARAGAGPQAEQWRGETSRKFPNSYYGVLLSGEVSAVSAGWEEAATQPPPMPDVPTPQATDKLEEDRINRVMALLEVGHGPGVKAELDYFINAAPPSAERMLWAGWMSVKAGNAGEAMRLASRARLIQAETGEGMNGEVWRLLYPAGYWDELCAATRDSMNQYLALALIRQESAFNPSALSPAGARGLMQLMPATGKTMYEGLFGPEKDGQNRFDEELLFDPAVNITLGVAHLSELARKYDGKLVYLVAAYNAGAVANRWMTRFAGVEDDEFVELIPYAETRDYVKKVTRNAVMYRRIYSGTGALAAADTGKK